MRVSRTRIITTQLILALALLWASGCGGPASVPGGSDAAGDTPELTQEIINERINDTWVRDVQEETGAGQPIIWNFDHGEPKEITVVDQQLNGTHATIVLDIKTSSAPRARNKRQLAGQIRTEWELRTGWALRQWEIVRTENISMKYRNLANPEASNTAPPPPANRPAKPDPDTGLPQ